MATRCCAALQVTAYAGLAGGPWRGARRVIEGARFPQGVNTALFYLRHMKFVEWKRGGVSREVICIGRWALKIPKLTRGWRQFLIGLLANMQERDLSKLGWPQLCPVAFALPGGWLVVMHRATPLTDEQAESLDPLSILSRDDYAIPAEPKASSFGVLGGRIVVVDYGDNCA
jgi:hypothetical protein